VGCRSAPCDNGVGGVVTLFLQILEAVAADKPRLAHIQHASTAKQVILPSIALHGRYRPVSNLISSLSQYFAYDGHLVGTQ
jgi:hypothetical protein